MPQGIEINEDELKEALIECEGQPVATAKKLGVDYTTVYKRIRQSPELQQIQKSYRAKSHNELANNVVFAAKTGYIKRLKLDENGKLTNEIELVPVDYKTQLECANKIIQLTKNDAGIVDRIEIQTEEKIVGVKLVD